MADQSKNFDQLLEDLDTPTTEAEAALEAAISAVLAKHTPRPSDFNVRVVGLDDMRNAPEDMPDPAPRGLVLEVRTTTGKTEWAFGGCKYTHRPRVVAVLGEIDPALIDAVKSA